VVTKFGISLFIFAAILLFFCGIKRSGIIKPAKSYFADPPRGREKKFLLFAIWLMIISLAVMFIGEAHWGGY